MKKLYRKNVIHPTPSDHLLYLLPSTLLTLTAALSSEERQVLAYLISSCSSNNNNNQNHRKFKKTTALDHPSSFDCYCFSCYTCYWVKWDSSPNRQLIHEILDGFEDEFLNENKKEKGNNNNKKNRGLKGKNKVSCKEKEKVSVELDEVKKCDTMENDDGIGGVSAVGDETIETSNVDEEEEEMEKGSIRRFVSFVGERIWGVWQV